MLRAVLLAVAGLVASAAGAQQPGYDGTARRADSPRAGAPSGHWEKLTMRPFQDSQGVVIVEMPFPSTWKVMSYRKPGEPTIVGPNGITIVDFPRQSFLAVRDQRLLQSYRQSGQQLRPMPGVEQLVQQDVVPWATKRGMKLTRLYEIPEISKVDQWYDDQLYKPVPTQSRAQAIGTDWVTANGDPYFILIHLMTSQTAQLQIWNYWATGLQAEKAHFAQAKDRLVFALSNARYNPQPIMAFNQSEAAKAGKSWAEHNRRMAQKQAAFEASQRAFVNRSNAAHDALMNNWRERNAASDKSHERFVDTITERTKVVDPSTGKQYKVEAGRNHYWMNADGRYLSTDRQDYDPNLDKGINNQKWQQLKKTE